MLKKTPENPLTVIENLEVHINLNLLLIFPRKRINNLKIK